MEGTTRKLLLTTAAIFALGACAGDTGRADVAAVVREACDAHADLAERVARLHQKGVPLSAVLAKLDQINGTEADPENQAEARADVIDIYGRPRFDTLEAQERAVARERDRAHSECMREMHFRFAR